MKDPDPDISGIVEYGLMLTLNAGETYKDQLKNVNFSNCPTGIPNFS